MLTGGTERLAATLAEPLGAIHALDVVAVAGAAHGFLRRRRPAARRIAEARARFYREAWGQAAAELGAEIRPLDGDILEITKGHQRALVFRNYTPLDDPVTLRLAGDKPAVLGLLTDAGLPVVPHRRFRPSRLGPALDLLSRTDGPFVVKPAARSAGWGVTMGVRHPADLLVAVYAAAVSPTEPLLVEPQVPGDVVRLLVLDGVVLDAVRNRPPTVVGDGRSTVRDLVAAANAERLSAGFGHAQTVLDLDAASRRCLAEQGLSPTSVPPSGAAVVVRRNTNSNTALDNERITDLVHPEVTRVAVAAADAVGARLAGIDVITPDPARPLAEVGGVVLEVNTTPGYYMHYHRDGPPAPVAVSVLAAALERRSSELGRP